MPFRDGASGLARLFCYCLQRCQWKKTIPDFHVSTATGGCGLISANMPLSPGLGNNVGPLRGRGGTQPKSGPQTREGKEQTEKVRDTDFRSPGSRFQLVWSSLAYQREPPAFEGREHSESQRAGSGLEARGAVFVR